MKRILSTLSFVLLSIAICLGQKNDADLVKEAFASYKSAVLNDQGEEAIKYVDSRTMKYYNKVLELVKTADSAQVDKLPLMDKLMVLLIRHRTTKEEILGFRDNELLIYAVNNGMVGKDGVAKNTIGKATVNKNFASAPLIVNGEEAPVDFHFYKEDGQWKIDITSLFKLSTMAFNKVIEESGKSENEFLLLVLQMATGKKPGSEVWQPTGT